MIDTLNILGFISAFGMAISLFWFSRFLNRRFRIAIIAWASLYILRIILGALDAYYLHTKGQSLLLQVMYQGSLILNLGVFLWLVRTMTDVEKSDRLASEVRVKKAELTLVTLRELVDTVTVIPWQDSKLDVEKSVEKAARIVERLRAIQKNSS